MSPGRIDDNARPPPHGLECIVSESPLYQLASPRTLPIPREPHCLNIERGRCLSTRKSHHHMREIDIVMLPKVRRSLDDKEEHWRCSSSTPSGKHLMAEGLD